MVALILSIPALILLCVVTAATLQELVADWHQMKPHERRWTGFLGGWGVLSVALLILAQVIG